MYDIGHLALDNGEHTSNGEVRLLVSHQWAVLRCSLDKRCKIIDVNFEDTKIVDWYDTYYLAVCSHTTRLIIHMIIDTNRNT